MGMRRVSTAARLAALVAFVLLLGACAAGEDEGSSAPIPPDDVAAADGPGATTPGGGGSEAASDDGSTEAGTAAGGTAAGEPIRIGVVGIMTGANAENGEFVRNGAQLAVDAINEAGGVVPAGESEGRPIELVVEDDQATPDVGLNAITKLVSQDEVFAFLGPDFSGITFPSLQVAADAGVPQITSSIAKSITEQGYDTIFRGRSNDETWIQATVDYLVEQGAQDIALSYTNIELGQSGVDVAKQYMAEEYDLSPVAEVAHNAGDRDLSPVASQLLLTEPDAIINWGTQIEASLLVRELSANGYEGEFAFNAADEIFTDLAQENAVGVIGPQNWVYTVEGPASQEFATQYLERFGRNPSPHSVVYYDGVQILAHSIEEAGLDQAAVLEYLGGVESYDGVQGEFRPAELEAGEMITTTVIIEIGEDLAPRVVETFE